MSCFNHKADYFFVFFIKIFTMKNLYTKNNLLNQLPDITTEKIFVENEINPARCAFDKSKITALENTKTIIYLMNRNYRVEDNFALNYALELSKKFSCRLIVLIFFEKKVLIKKKEIFLKENFEILKTNLKLNNIDYIFIKGKIKDIKIELESKNPAIVISDFNPLLNTSQLSSKYNFLEIDSFNVVPAFYVIDKQSYNAASFRRAIYKKIYPFLTEFPKIKFKKNKGYTLLKKFLNQKLQDYAKYKNNPNYNVLSELSPYISNGFISSQRITLEVLKANETKENKESFLEELIIRKELADNFCYYTQNYKNIISCPDWAKNSLEEHKNDFRILYKIEELENAKTNDNLWNATQLQLKKEGKIHGYLRMYWAKQIAKWSINAQEAIEKAIYLNDKYALDAPSCNGYTNILWSIGGLHDRPFQDRPVTGKIRTMTYNGAKSKFNVEEYIKKYT